MKKQKVTNGNMAVEPDNLQNLMKGFPKENPFVVPEGYFNALPTKIQEKIAIVKHESFWSWAMKSIWKPAYAVTLSVIAVLLVVTFLFFHRTSSTSSSSFSDITFNDLMNENPELVENMDESLLVEAFASVNSDASQQYLENQFDNDINVSQDKLIEYLSDDPDNSIY